MSYWHRHTIGKNIDESVTSHCFLLYHRQCLLKNINILKLNMSGLSRFSDDVIIRMKKLKFIEGKSYGVIAQIVNMDRSSVRLRTSQGIRNCLKRMSSQTTKRVYERKLGSVACSIFRGRRG